MSTAQIDIELAADLPASLTAERLAALLRFALAAEGVDHPLAVSLFVTDDATIQHLHARHLAIDEPTDVLTFALDDPTPATNRADRPFVSAEPLPLLGEIVVSHQTAAAQAGEQGHTPAREIAFLALHGLLHLLGYTDLTPAERQAMLARQTLLLADFERQSEADG